VGKEPELNEGYPRRIGDGMTDPGMTRKANGVLLITVGMSSLPIVLTVLALEPSVVQMICTEGSLTVAEGVRNYFETLHSTLAIEFPNALSVKADDPADIRDQLDGLELEHCDVAYAGGTTALSANALRWWDAKVGGERSDGPASWYLAERSRELISGVPDRRLDISQIRGVPRELGQLLDIFGIDYREIQSALSVKVNEETWKGSEVFPFSTPSDDAEKPEDAKELLQTLARIAHGLFTSGKVNGQDRKNWNRISANANLQLPGDNARQVGFALELLVFTLVSRYYGQLISSKRVDPLFPINVSLGTKVSRPDGKPFVEVDVLVQYGPRVLLVSCGVDSGAGPLTLKYQEAKDRAKQLGGGEGRSITIGHRSGTTQSGQRRTLAQHRSLADEQRMRTGIVSDAEADRHSFFGLAEILPISDDEDPEYAKNNLSNALNDPTGIKIGDKEPDFYSRLASLLR
jgi:hypothetical protein